jgi:hypothetical protein
MVLYACVFSHHRGYPDMILRDELLISKVVLSHVLPLMRIACSLFPVRRLQQAQLDAAAGFSPYEREARARG